MEESKENKCCVLCAASAPVLQSLCKEY